MREPLPKNGLVTMHGLLAGTKLGCQFTFQFVIVLGVEHVLHGGAMGALEEHANKHHSSDDIAEGDRQEVPKYYFCKRNSRSKYWTSRM